MILSQWSGDWDLHTEAEGSRSESDVCYSLVSHALLPGAALLSLVTQKGS